MKKLKTTKILTYSRIKKIRRIFLTIKLRFQNAPSGAAGGPSSSLSVQMDQTHFLHFNSTEEGQIPGRRTPLGAVGLGGFYFQGCPANVGHGPPSDENNPNPSGSGLNR